MAWLLIDNSNTRTKFALGDDTRLSAWRTWLPTGDISKESLGALTLPDEPIAGVLLCSVVPDKARVIREFFEPRLPFHAMSARSRLNIGIDYPQPEQIGADRLANAVAACRHFGAPVVVVDFGTAVTFDVVDARGDYVGGIIAPGLAAMTDYLHEKTALLPQIKIREVTAVVGKNTEQAMLIGAVHGYRGLVRELIGELKRELKAAKLPVVATGGYAKLMAAKLPEITAVEPGLTLEGLRLVFAMRRG